MTGRRNFLTGAIAGAAALPLLARGAWAATPEIFAPGGLAINGYDPVAYRKSGQLVAGHRAHGLTYKNHMFLFASEQSLEEFSASPEAYLGIVQQAMNSRPMTR